MMKPMSFSDSTRGRIKNMLKTIFLSGWKIELNGVAIVKLRMNQRGGYGTRCGAIDGVTATSVSRL